MNMQNDNKPWYQHRWPWILGFFPAVSVVLGVILITTALRNPAILVVDNYYAEGRGINRSMALDDAAAERGMSAVLMADGSVTHLQLLSASDAHNAEEALSLSVYHVTDNTLDQVFVFAPAADSALSAQGYYETATEEDNAALLALLARDTSWYLEIRGAGNDWRLRKRISTPLQEVSF